MRTASRTARASRRHAAAPAVLAFLATVLIVTAAACGQSGTPAPPGGSSNPNGQTAQPTSTLHISGSVDANRVFQLLSSARLPVHQETLGAPGPHGEPNATLFIVDGAIKVAIDQFSSDHAVAAAGYVDGSKLVKGDSPYTIWAANIVIHIGTRVENALPPGPDSATAAAADAIAKALDPYLGPLGQRSVVPLILPSTPEPSATPTPPPAATPTPTPSTKASPKPTKKPKPTKHP